MSRKLKCSVPSRAILFSAHALNGAATGPSGLKIFLMDSNRLTYSLTVSSSENNEALCAISSESVLVSCPAAPCSSITLPRCDFALDK